MHLKSKETPAPAAGDTQRIPHFAWMPKRVGGVKVWLSQWEELQVWEERTVMVKTKDGLTHVTVGEWVTISKKPVKWIPA